MSISIKLTELTDNHWTTIRDRLWFKPKANFYRRNQFSTEPDVKPIKLFYKQDDEVLIPFTFANCLLGKFLVSNTEFPKIDLRFKVDLWEKQRSVVDEAADQLNRYHTTTLWLPCGFGKTVISAHLACRINRMTVVVFKSKILKKQWLDSFNTFTNAKTWIVGDQSMPDEPPDVIICMVLQVYKIPELWMDSIGTLILDEVHELCTKEYSKGVMKIRPCYIIACTATPIKENGAHTVLYNLCGTHNVHRLPDKSLLVYQFLTGIKFTMSVTKNGDPNWNGLCEEIAKCRIRNEMIVRLVHSFWKRKIIILTVRTDHREILYKMLADTESVAKLTKDKDTYSTSRVLIGTFSKIGTGFDEATSCIDFDGRRIDMLIMVGSTKSKTRVVQALGRAERSDNPMVIDLVDDNGSIQRHWKVRRAIYNKRKAKIEVLTESQIETAGNGPKPTPPTIRPVFIINDGH